MKKYYLFTVFIMICTIGTIVRGAENKETAQSWQKQATSTRAQVASVAEELTKIGDKGNPDAKGLIEDATNWLKEGDKELAKGDEAMKKEEWENASFGYNMAWQYYVKAATAGLNAKRILTGQ
jgi:nitrous-oxide reductase